MATAVDTTKDFQERMFARVRDQIGDLLGEDDLKRIVETTLERSFFERRQAKEHEGYNARTITKPSVFEEMTAELLKPMVEREIGRWLKENAAKVEEMVTGVVQAGMAAALLKALEEKTRGPLYELQSKLLTEGVLR